MVRQFDALAEVRKHPGIAGGVVAVLAGVGLAAILLGQRTGPTRYERLRERLDPRGWDTSGWDPRGWVDAEALRERFDDIARGVRGHAEDFSERAAERAGEFRDEAHDRADRWFRSTRKKASKGGKRALRNYKKQARRYAEDAGDFVSDHPKETGALLAVATVAALVGAVVLESRREGSPLRDIAKF